MFDGSRHAIGRRCGARAILDAPDFLRRGARCLHVDAELRQGHRGQKRDEAGDQFDQRLHLRRSFSKPVCFMLVFPLKRKQAALTATGARETDEAQGRRSP